MYTCPSCRAASGVIQAANEVQTIQLAKREILCARCKECDCLWVLPLEIQSEWATRE